MNSDEMIIIGIALIAAVYYIYRTFKPSGSCGCGKDDCPSRHAHSEENSH